MIRQHPDQVDPHFIWKNAAASYLRPESSKDLLSSFAQLTKLDVALNNLIVRARLGKSFKSIYNITLSSQPFPCQEALSPSV